MRHFSKYDNSNYAKLLKEIEAGAHLDEVPLKDNIWLDSPNLLEKDDKIKKFARFKIIMHQKNNQGKYDFPKERILEMEPTFNEADGKISKDIKANFRIMQVTAGGVLTIETVFNNQSVLCPDIM